MVPARTESPLFATLQSVPWLSLGQLLCAALLIVFLFANVLRLIERGRDPTFPKTYWRAIGEALWGTTLIIATGEHGERNAPGVVKRVAVASMWLVGVVLIAHLTATVTSSQTVQRLQSSIQGPGDLPGKMIGTLPGSDAADYLTRRGLSFVGVRDGPDAIRMLLRRELDAIVFDAPTLQYWAAREGSAGLRVVGPIFSPHQVRDGGRRRKSVPQGDQRGAAQPLRRRNLRADLREMVRATELGASLGCASMEETLMFSSMKTMALAGLLLATSASAAEAPGTAKAEEPNTEALAKAAQNPVADMISIPFQDDIGFGYGPGNKDTQNVLNIQPVIPLHVTEDWNVITRTILPIVTPAELHRRVEHHRARGPERDRVPLAEESGDVIWGVGPVATFPTATSPFLGSQSTWGLGPSAVVLAMPGHWVLGVLVNQSLVGGGREREPDAHPVLRELQLRGGLVPDNRPHLDRRLERGVGPAVGGPFGAGGGKIFRIGKLPFNGNVSAYYNAVRPDIGPEWTLRVQLALLLPDSIF